MISVSCIRLISTTLLGIQNILKPALPEHNLSCKTKGKHNAV